MSHLVERKVLSRDQALAIGHKLLSLINDDAVGVSIEHSVRAVTKMSNGAHHTTVDGDWVTIRFTSMFGSGLPVLLATNQLDDATLERVVTYASAIRPPKLSDRPDSIDTNDPEHFTYNAREYPPVSLWHDTTNQAMDQSRGAILHTLLDRFHASGLIGAATVGLSARSVLYLYKYGLTAFAEETDSEVTVTTRTADLLTSGWAGQADRDWSKIDPDHVASQAIELTNQGRRPVAIEPGRRTAILSPAAVAQLVSNMASLFSAGRTLVRGQHGTPLTFVNYEETGRHTKLGLQVFDPRLTLISDPADPLGGFPPFFEFGGLETGVHGYPTPAITWVERGILKHLAYNVSEGLTRNLTPCDVPRSVRMIAAPEAKIATIPEMIANCADGIYVNRLSEVALIDSRTGMMTGTTRDGCFLIKNGRIEKPVKNFRFTDSPFLAFNRLEMIGAPERAAFGYNTTPGNWEEWLRWPRLPVIVPPLMVRDFNFSGMVDAI